MSYQSKHTGAAIDTSVDTTQKILNMIYPVGSVYMSVNNVSPANFIGGTWERIQDRFLLAAGSSYGAGTSGGAASHTHTTAGHTLTINEMPNHQHQVVKYVGMVNNTAAFGINDSNFDGLVGSDVMSSTVNSVAVTEAQKATIIGYTGGSASHSHGNTGSTSNLPPYLSVYMWKRTA